MFHVLSHFSHARQSIPFLSSHDYFSIRFKPKLVLFVFLQKLKQIFNSRSHYYLKRLFCRVKNENDSRVSNPRQYDLNSNAKYFFGVLVFSFILAPTKAISACPFHLEKRVSNLMDASGAHSTPSA